MSAQEPKRKIVGIDLGTTNSVIAHFDEYGKVDVLPNSDNERTTPSVILFEDGEAIVGRIAKNLAASSPEKVVQFVKRRMGEPEWRREIDGHAFSAEVLSAMILKRMVNDAETQLGQPVTDVVITCPAYFNDLERRQTREAGRIAGLNVLGILNESTAAALAYGLNKRDQQVKALVFDLGGGTLDVTVLRIDGNDIRVLASDGERQLGGKDWDDVLVERVAEEFYLEHGVDPREVPESLQDLILRAEEAKKALSQKPTTKVFVQCKGHSLKATIAREEFEKLSAKLLARCARCVERTLRKSGLEWSEVDSLLLVGGSTRMPMVRGMLERMSGKRSDQWINPDECVAIGATYWGAILLLREAQALKERAAADEGASRLADSMEEAVPEDLIVLLGEAEVTNVNSHSLGVLTIGKDGRRSNECMIPEQTPLPHAVEREFVTWKDDQRNVEIRILEGAARDPSACVDIGRCWIEGLPPGRPRGARIAVRYSYGEDGVLEVRARDVETGREVTARFQSAAATLSEEEVALQGRKVAHLLQTDEMGLATDSDEQLLAEFEEGYFAEDG